jgi:hypothetical protein
MRDRLVAHRIRISVIRWYDILLRFNREAKGSARPSPSQCARSQQACLQSTSIRLRLAQDGAVEDKRDATSINLQSLSFSSSCLVSLLLYCSYTCTDTPHVRPLAMKYTWIPKDTYGNASDLRGKCEKLIEKDLLIIEAKKQGASGIDIIKGAHQSDLDKSMHLTAVYDKRIKGKQHIPATDLPTVFCICYCSLQ